VSNLKLCATRRLYGLGVALSVTMIFAAHSFSGTRPPSFVIPLSIAGVVYLLAIRELLSTPKFPKHLVITGLLFAAIWQIPFLVKTPGADDDIHRYLWDGRIQRLGYNPYLVVPNAPALRSLHTVETRTLNHPDLPSPYPPAAELFFRAVISIHESLFAMKVALFICGLAIVPLLLEVLHRSGKGAHWVLAFAWHPLLAIDVAGSGHVDILGALILLVSFAALARRWRSVAAVTLGLAVAVKFLPIILLPLYWKRIRMRDTALAAVTLALLYLPFLNHGHIPTGSLGTYVHSFWFNDPVFAALEHVAPPEIIAGFAVLIGFLTAFWLRSTSDTVNPGAFAWPMAASLLCAPVVYPWYLLWMLPFLRSAWTLPLIVWTVSILPTYEVWHLRALGKPFIVPGWILLAEYGSVAMAAVALGFRWMRSLKTSAPEESKT